MGPGGGLVVARVGLLVIGLGFDSFMVPLSFLNVEQLEKCKFMKKCFNFLTFALNRSAR